MKTKIVFLISVIALLLCDFAYSQEEQKSGILYGPDWACLVTAPTGWIMDQNTWAQNHIYGLFYEQGKQFSSKIPIVYINTQKLNAATDQELQNFIDWDTRNVSKDPRNSVSERKLDLSTDRKVVCYDFNINNQQFETIAYTRFKDTPFQI